MDYPPLEYRRETLGGCSAASQRFWPLRGRSLGRYFALTPRYYSTVPIDRVRNDHAQRAVWTMHLGLMPSAWAATFDCNKLSTFVEKAICSDSRLTSMDDQLGRLYKDALAASSNSAALKTEQKAWLS
jgi:hypothetical protein